MRTAYALSEPTRKILADNVKPIAEQMDVTTNYLHQILAGYETDAFAKFRRMYAACVRAGVDVSAWDASLAEAKIKANQNRTVTDCLSTLLQDEAKTASLVVESLDKLPEKAGEITLAIEKTRTDLEVLEDKVFSARETGAAIVEKHRTNGGNGNGKSRN